MKTIDVIFAEVETTFGFTPRQLRSQARPGGLAWARMVTCTLLREKTDMPLREVGKSLRRTIGAVFHAEQTVHDRESVDRKVAAQLTGLRDRIDQRISATK